MEYIVPIYYLFCYKDEKFVLRKFYDLGFPLKGILKDIEGILKKSNGITLKMMLDDNFLKIAKEFMETLHISEDALIRRLEEYITMDTAISEEHEAPIRYIESLEDIVKYYVYALTKYPPHDVILVVDSLEEIPMLILDALNGDSERFLEFIKESIAYSTPYSRLQLLKEVLEEKYNKKIKIEYQ